MAELQRARQFFIAVSSAMGQNVLNMDPLRQFALENLYWRYLPMDNGLCPEALMEFNVIFDVGNVIDLHIIDR